MQREQQPREVLDEDRPGNQERITRQARREQRGGDERYTVPQVGDRARRPELLVLGSEAACHPTLPTANRA